MSNPVDLSRVPVRVLATGEEIPAIGMGTFGSDHASPESVAEAVYGALKAGYRLLDCAAVYGNEPLIGEVLERAYREGIARREDIFLMSKVWNNMHGAGDVLISCATSLRDLKTDTLDAFFVHWPFPNYHAPGCDGDSRNPDSVPFSAERFLQTWRQMEKLVDMGLTRNLGMSNMTIAKLEAVLPHCRVQPTLIEMEMHPSFQQPELYDYCIQRGIQPIGFSPIGSPARPARDTAPDDIADIEMPEIKRIAQAHGVHPALICLKWAVQRGQIPIPFSVREPQYMSNLRCVTEDPLTEEEMRVIASLDRNCRLIKGQVFLWPSARSWEDLWDVEGVITA